MLDTFHVRAGDQHHHHRSEVHEHRAPTDASVKLLRELEAAALDKVLATYRLEGCEVDCIVHHMRSIMGDEDDFILRYKLGTKEHRVEHTHRRRIRDTDHEARQYLADELVRELGKSIASNLLGPAMNKAMPQRWPA